MREKILAAVSNANRYYLARVLERNQPEQHERIRGLFNTHMGVVADYCIKGYGGAGTLTTAFIRGLHKILFPGNYRQTITTPQGEVAYMVPGEYKVVPNQGENMAFPGTTNVYIAPVDVAEALEYAIGRVNKKLVSGVDAQGKRDAIIFFVLDFEAIHPFSDANGRVICILIDLLLINEGLKPIYVNLIKEMDLTALYRGVDLAIAQQNLKPLYEVIERYNPEALADR